MNNTEPEFEIKRSNNFTIVDNRILRDKSLSLKAIGLLCKILSLPPNWDFSFNGLVAICLESKDAIRTTINELKRNGYIEVTRYNNSKGQFAFKYKVYDFPKSLLSKENKPSPEYPLTDEPKTDIHTQLNTNILIDKKDKTLSINELNIFTKELIKTEYIDYNEYNIYYYNNLFDTLIKNNYSKQEIFSSIHYISNKIKSNKYRDEEGNKITNKYGYFKNALDSNLKRLESFNEINDDYDWLNDDSDYFINKKTNDRER